MKKYVIMLIAVLICTYTMCADAKDGSVNIVMPASEKITLTYSKVADVINGEYVLKEEYEESGVCLNDLKTAKETERAIQQLQPLCKDKTLVTNKEDGGYLISNLEEGVYLIEGAEGVENYIPPTLVTIPTVDTDTKQVLYDITVIPKIEICTEPVESGDYNNLYFLSVIFAISLIIVAILSCQKSFGYGRMTE